ncbi:MAG: PqqD family protein, partial [Calditrichia bacterium]
GMIRRKKEMPDQEQIIKEWLPLIPLQKIDFKSDEQKKITLLIPHEENWFTQRFLPKPKHPAKKLHLDEVGSAVWNLCDGIRTVQEICGKLQESFQEKVSPVEERTVLFLQQMYQTGAIEVYARESALK